MIHVDFDFSALLTFMMNGHPKVDNDKPLGRLEIIHHDIPEPEIVMSNGALVNGHDALYQHHPAHNIIHVLS